MKAVILICIAGFVASACKAGPAKRFIAIEERLMERAKQIPIARVDFKDATFSEVLERLRAQAKAQNPKHQDIPIEVHAEPYPDAKSKNAKDAPPGGWPLCDPMKQRITFSLRNTSLAKALSSATALVNCRVVPSRTALMIKNNPSSYDLLITHTIPLATAPKAEVQKMHADPKQYFTERGAVFSVYSTCSFEDDGATLVVTETLDQLEIVELILEGLIPPGANERIQVTYKS